MSSVVDRARERKQEIDERQAQRDAFADFYKFKEGTTRVRVLPPLLIETGEGEVEVPWAVETFMHFNITEAPISCPRRIAEEGLELAGYFGLGDEEACASCDEVTDLYASKVKEDADLAGEIYSKHRVFFNAVIRSDPDGESESEGPEVIPCGPQIYNQLIDILCDPDYGDITDIENGFDVKITRKGTSKTTTEYKVLPCREPTPLAASDEAIDKILDAAKNLFDVPPKLLSYDEAAAAVKGEEPPQAEDEAESPDAGTTEEKFEDEEKPARSSRRRTAATSKAAKAEDKKDKPNIAGDLRNRIAARRAKKTETKGEASSTTRRRRR